MANLRMVGETADFTLNENYSLEIAKRGKSGDRHKIQMSVAELLTAALWLSRNKALMSNMILYCELVPVHVSEKEGSDGQEVVVTRFQGGAP